MTAIATLTLTGRSGNKYEFEVYSLGNNFNAVGAVYAVTKRTEKLEGGGNHDVIYVGQTHDLSERFDQHHKADCFRRNKSNCACIHLDNSQSSRLTKEADLIEAHNPPCND